MNGVKELVFDLHVDLLSYLADEEGRSASDRESRSSIPQLLEGGVGFQVLPIFTRTEDGSVGYMERQLEKFRSLLDSRHDVQRISSLTKLAEIAPGRDVVSVALAFENASGFCEESEPLERGLARLDKIFSEHGPLAYVSLTWNGENRFGGGCGSTAGLKEDGRALLGELEKRSIAVDLSHATDQLASEILDVAEREGGHLKVIASHSNFRSVSGQPRNLPDQIAGRIIAADGLIGLNSIEEFLGGCELDVLARHISHGLALGGQGALALGSDFFNDGDVPPEYRSPEGRPMFAPYWSSSCCYPAMIRLLGSSGCISDAGLEGLRFKNAARVLSRITGPR